MKVFLFLLFLVVVVFVVGFKNDDKRTAASLRDGHRGSDRTNYGDPGYNHDLKSS